MFNVIKEFLDVKTDFHLLRNIHEEIKVLENLSKSLTINPHGKYNHITPDFLINTKKSLFFDSKDEWSILQVYTHKKLLQEVQNFTKWKTVHLLPLQTTKGFEINNKINFYSSEQCSRLDWHFDKVYNYRGNQVVCVYTIQNDWDYIECLVKPHNLEVLNNGKIQKIYLGGNTLTIHNPDTIFHRVIPFTNGKFKSNFKRTVFVMRYTDDPTPILNVEKFYGILRFGIKNAIYCFIVKDTKWSIYLICGLLIILQIFLCFIKFKNFFIQ